MFVQIDTVDVRQFGEAAIAADYVEAGIPVVINGLTSDWKATRLWDAPYFLSLGADQLEIDVESFTPDGKKDVRMPLSEFVSYWEGYDEGNPPQLCLYLNSWVFGDDLPQLLQDYTVPKCFGPNLMERLGYSEPLRWLFIGHAHAPSKLHVDIYNTSSWLAMIQGSKQIRLFDPKVSDYIASVLRPQYPGELDVYDSSALRFLEERGVTGFECVLRKGQVLYLPGRWMHQIRNRDKNILLTENFCTERDWPHVLRSVLVERRSTASI